jgi:hypothetical protein
MKSTPPDSRADIFWHILLYGFHGSNKVKSVTAVEKFLDITAKEVRNLILPSL